MNFFSGLPFLSTLPFPFPIPELHRHPVPPSSIIRDDRLIPNPGFLYEYWSDNPHHSQPERSLARAPYVPIRLTSHNTTDMPAEFNAKRLCLYNKKTAMLSSRRPVIHIFIHSIHNKSPSIPLINYKNFQFSGHKPRKRGFRSFFFPKRTQQEKTPDPFRDFIPFFSLTPFRRRHPQHDAGGFRMIWHIFAFCQENETCW